MGIKKIKYFIENRRTKEILRGPKSLDQRHFGRTKDILVCGGRTKTDFKDRDPTAPIPQGTCTWQSPAQPLPSSLQSGLPLTACLQLKSPSAVLEGHIYNHRIERHWPLVKHVRLFSHQYCVYDSPLVSTLVTHSCHDVDELLKAHGDTMVPG